MGLSELRIRIQSVIQGDCSQFQACELSETANKASKKLSHSFLVFLNKFKACTGFN